MKIAEVEGIGAANAALLQREGVFTTESLLERGASEGGRRRLAAATGIAYAQVLEWVNHADLMRLDGVGSEYSDLLEAAGVDSPAELAHRNAANLAETFQEVALARPGIVRRIPGEHEVATWIAQAKTLPKVVTHGGGHSAKAEETAMAGAPATSESPEAGEDSAKADSPTKADGRAMAAAPETVEAPAMADDTGPAWADAPAAADTAGMADAAAMADDSTKAEEAGPAWADEPAMAAAAVAEAEEPVAADEVAADEMPVMAAASAPADDPTPAEAPEATDEPQPRVGIPPYMGSPLNEPDAPAAEAPSAPPMPVAAAASAPKASGSSAPSGSSTPARPRQAPPKTSMWGRFKRIIGLG